MPAARTVPDLLDELARRFPDREALVGSGQRYTFRQLRDEVRRATAGFAALGVKKNDKVAILMGNVPEWIIADFAILALGGVMVAVNTWCTTRELEYILAHSDSTLLVTSGRYLRYDYLAMLAEIAPRAERLPQLREVILVSDRSAPGCTTWSELLARGTATPPAELDAAQRAVHPQDLAYLLYTSGSTAAPKGVEIQHFGLIENMWHIGERQHVTEHDRLWLAVSLFWGLGCENALFNLYTHGGCVVLQEAFEPGEALAIIEQEKCSVFYGTPNMAQAMAEHPDRAKRDLSSLRGGATIGTPEQMMRVVDMGAREICNIYGLTETYGNCNVTDASASLESRLNNVGRALPGVEQRIVDAETGAILPAGQVGEVRVKGYVTSGYFKDPVRTAEAFDEQGFFRTGDLGFLDEEGHLYFRGRIKEMVKTGGINVAPIEVEEILLGHAAVHAAFCCGVPDPVRDEILAAVIITKPGATVTEAELDAHCRGSLASYKLPRRYRFVAESELPLTTTGKLQKNRLAEVFFSG